MVLPPPHKTRQQQICVLIDRLCPSPRALEAAGKIGQHDLDRTGAAGKRPAGFGIATLKVVDNQRHAGIPALPD